MEQKKKKTKKKKQKQKQQGPLNDFYRDLEYIFLMPENAAIPEEWKKLYAIKQQQTTPLSPHLFSSVALILGFTLSLIVGLVLITLILSTAVLVAFLELILALKPLLDQVRLHDLPARILRTLGLQPMIDDSLIGLSGELFNVQSRVEETETLELLISFEADANEEGDLLIGSHDVEAEETTKTVPEATWASDLTGVDVHLVEEALLFLGEGGVGDVGAGGHGVGVCVLCWCVGWENCLWVKVKGGVW
jgi:hypothetical protein